MGALTAGEMLEVAKWPWARTLPPRKRDRAGASSFEFPSSNMPSLRVRAQVVGSRGKKGEALGVPPSKSHSCRAGGAPLQIQTVNNALSSKTINGDWLTDPIRFHHSIRCRQINLEPSLSLQTIQHDDSGFPHPLPKPCHANHSRGPLPEYSSPVYRTPWTRRFPPSHEHERESSTAALFLLLLQHGQGSCRYSRVSGLVYGWETTTRPCFLPR